MTRTDYACSGSEDEVTREVSCEGLFPRPGQGLLRSILEGTKIAVARVIPQRVTSRDGTRDETSARTQVYLSKTKLKLQVGI